MPGSPMVISDPVDALRAVGVGKVFNQGLNGVRRDAGILVAPHHTAVPSYVVGFNVAATAALDILSIAGLVNKVTRLRRIVLVNPGSATAAAVVDLALGVASFNGNGGSLVQSQSLDQQPRPAGMTGGPDANISSGLTRQGDTTQATGFSAVYAALATISVPNAAGAFNPLVLYDARDPLCKALTVVGGAVCINLRTPIVGAGATGLRGYAEFTVDDA